MCALACLSNPSSRHPPTVIVVALQKRHSRNQLANFVIAWVKVAATGAHQITLSPRTHLQGSPPYCHDELPLLSHGLDDWRLALHKPLQSEELVEDLCVCVCVCIVSTATLPSHVTSCDIM